MGETADEKLARIALLAQDPSLTAEEKNKQITAVALNLAGSQSSVSNETNGLLNGEVGGDLTAEQKYDLITANLQEVLDPQIIRDVLNKGERPLCIYWGTAPTGRPHCAYFVCILQIASFLRAGCRVRLLLADLHGFLDNLKAPIELVKYRAEYYKYVIVELLKAVGVSVERLEFVLGSSHQLTKEYQMDLFRLCTMVTIHDARRAGADVVKQVENATLSGLIYPLMQSLDEVYLGVDVQFGGVDQRKIFTMAKEVLPKIGYKEQAHLMSPMVPGLAGGKMSASDPDSKIDVLDAPEVVTRKIKKAFAVPRETADNGLLSFVEHVFLPASALKEGKARFVVEPREGDPIVYESIEKMKEDYTNDVLTPQMLKSAVSKALNDLLAPVQAAFQASPEWQELLQKAYPPPPEELKKLEKKMKKQNKDKGTRAPGKNVEANPDGSVQGEDKGNVSVGKSVEDAMKELKVEKKALDES